MKAYVAPKIEVVELEEEVGTAGLFGSGCDIQVDGNTAIGWGGPAHCDNPDSDWGGD